MKSGEVKAAATMIKETLRKNDRIARYIGGSFNAQVEKVYVELGGQPFAKDEAAAGNASTAWRTAARWK
jgi:hypothetical protein